MSIVVSLSGQAITVADMIKASLRVLQVQSPDVDLTAEEYQNGLQALNMMIDGWSNESMMLHHISKETFQTVANTPSYTIGYGAVFNTDRPIAIEAMTVSVSGTDCPVEQMAYDDYAAIGQKTLTTNFPQYFYVDEGVQFSTLHLWPVPASPPPEITLYMRKPLGTFTDVTEQIILPRGYLRAFKFNLAVEMAPEFQTNPGDYVVKMAMTSKADLKRTNHRAITMQPDIGLTGLGTSYNINTNR
jgi:hypothetical protein